MYELFTGRCAWGWPWPVFDYGKIVFKTKKEITEPRTYAQWDVGVGCGCSELAGIVSRRLLRVFDIQKNPKKGNQKNGTN
jgi:hypothetical protein